MPPSDPGSASASASAGRPLSKSGRLPKLPQPETLTKRFRPLFTIGRGGMGSIEVAVETKEDGTDRVVALKRMLPSASADKRHTEMFLREAKLASMLDHPNVVHAMSFGELAGELFLVLEYIEGEPLSRVVARAQERGISLALPVVAHVLAEICEGLHAAHELADDEGTPLAVVHRDVSPQNVMVAYEGHAKLLDFGVAKIEALEADGRTKTGEVKGKTSYMSPEQAMGDPIDRRSDLYSLGAILFEAVSGKKMWGGGTDLEVLRRMALEEPPPLERVAPSTPPAICRLQHRLVSRDPDKRPATALEVARELRTFIASTGTHPEAKVVRQLMHGLFAEEIERRRATLTKAIDQTVPATAEQLRASLPVLPTIDETPFPSTRSRLAGSGAWPRSKRGVATLAAGFGAAAVVAGLLWWKGGEPAGARVTSATTAAATSTATSAAIANPSATATPTSAVTGSAAAPPRSTATATATANANATPPAIPAASPRRGSTSSPSPSTAPEPVEHAPPGAASAKARQGDQVRTSPAASTKPTVPLDVDPSPF